MMLVEALDDLATRTRSMARAHGLSAVALDESLAHREGDWNGRALVLTTEQWRGEGALARVQIAVVRSEGDAMSSLTVIALPSARTACPVLGADLVAFGGGLGTVIVDLTPMGAPPSADGRRRNAGARAALEAVSEPRGWTDEGPSPFSADAVFVSPPRSAAGLELSVAAYREYLGSFEAEIGHATVGHAPVAAAGQQALLHRLSSAKKQARSLARLFGAE